MDFNDFFELFLIVQHASEFLKKFQRAGCKSRWLYFVKHPSMQLDVHQMFLVAINKIGWFPGTDPAFKNSPQIFSRVKVWLILKPVLMCVC